MVHRIKISFLVLLISLFFTSCSYFNDYFIAHDFTITNNSSYDLTFKVKNYGDTLYNLSPSASIKLELFDHPNFIIINNLRVSYNTGVSSAEFYDMEKNVYTISNMCFYDVIVSDKNNMLTDTYGASVTVPAASAVPNPSGGYSAAASSIDVYVYGKQAPQLTAYYLDENNNKVNATGFITFVKN